MSDIWRCFIERQFQVQRNRMLISDWTWIIEWRWISFESSGPWTADGKLANSSVEWIICLHHAGSCHVLCKKSQNKAREEPWEAAGMRGTNTISDGFSLRFVLISFRQGTLSAESVSVRVQAELHPVPSIHNKNQDSQQIVCEQTSP